MHRELCVQDTARMQVFEGAKNNLPDDDAHMAAQAIEKLASNIGRNDILFVLISGTQTSGRFWTFLSFTVLIQPKLNVPYQGNI